jgi:hypothetical protein
LQPAEPAGFSSRGFATVPRRRRQIFAVRYVAHLVPIFDEKNASAEGGIGRQTVAVW